MFFLNKFSLIVLTRCNLRCKLCCEYVPQHKPFSDMSVEEAKRILGAVFEVCDHITTLHLTGGGEPFLHPQLTELVEAAMEHAEKFDKLMLFTNSTVPIKSDLLDVIIRYKDKIVVQLSQYGISPTCERATAKVLLDEGIICKIEKYYGDDQSFGGWIDFGKWESYGRTPDELERTFKQCSVTCILKGNWRTRNGKVHWCTRSQRGNELGFLSDNSDDYVDLFDDTSLAEKRRKFNQIAESKYLSVCDHCSGDAGTDEKTKRYKAAEQEVDV